MSFTNFHELQINYKKRHFHKKINPKIIKENK